MWEQNLMYFVNQGLWLVVKDHFLESRVCTNDAVVTSNQKKNIHVLELARMLPKLQRKHWSKSAIWSIKKKKFEPLFRVAFHGNDEGKTEKWYN